MSRDRESGMLGMLRQMIINAKRGDERSKKQLEDIARTSRTDYKKVAQDGLDEVQKARDKAARIKAREQARLARIERARHKKKK